MIVHSLFLDLNLGFMSKLLTRPEYAAGVSKGSWLLFHHRRNVREPQPWLCQGKTHGQDRKGVRRGCHL